MAVLQDIRPEARGEPADGLIASITYRSRANRKQSWADLDALTRAAQRRNRNASLSGMLLYENDRFFQCIEGPPDALEAVWESIRADPRHREVDVLSMKVGPNRLFAGWDMHWLRKGEQAGSGLDFLEPIAPAEDLAKLVLDADAEAVIAEISRQHAKAPLAQLLDYVLEPTARALGDAWMRDDIDSLSLTLALSRLNVMTHEWAQRGDPARAVDKRLLAVTLPREVHIFGAVAAAELHFDAGWQVDLEFPEKLEHLIRLIGATSYDRADIATSDAINRADVRAQAPALAARLQQASRNPDIEVSFGGRAFWTEGSGSELKRCVYRSSAAGFRL